MLLVEASHRASPDRGNHHLHAPPPFSESPRDSPHTSIQERRRKPWEEPCCVPARKRFTIVILSGRRRLNHEDVGMGNFGGPWVRVDAALISEFDSRRSAGTLGYRVPVRWRWRAHQEAWCGKPCLHPAAPLALRTGGGSSREGCGRGDRLEP